MSPMSPLAFDKQGRPFPFHPRTRKLRVRLFRNPSTRGTCCQVLDATGQPLYVDVETDYLAFRRLIGNVPGMYRLDQCDEDGVEIDDAPPAYVSIDVPREPAAAGSADVNPLVIIERMAAIQADVMKTMASQQAALLSASAEILRAPFRPAPDPVPAASYRNLEMEEPGDERGEEVDEDAELEDEDAPAGPWAALQPVMAMIEPHLPTLGAFLYQQLRTLAKRAAADDAAAPMASPAQPSPGAAPSQPPPPRPAESVPPSPVGATTGAAPGPSSSVASCIEVEPPTASDPTSREAIADEMDLAAHASIGVESVSLVEVTEEAPRDDEELLAHDDEGALTLDGEERDVPPIVLPEPQRPTISVPATSMRAPAQPPPNGGAMSASTAVRVGASVMPPTKRPTPTQPPSPTSSSPASPPTTHAPRPPSAPLAAGSRPAGTTQAAPAPAPSTMVAVASPPNAASPPREALPEPTPEQISHLLEIRQRLTQTERSIAEHAIARMTPDMLAHWLAELSAMTVDEATGMLRRLIAQVRAAHPRPGR